MARVEKSTSSKGDKDVTKMRGELKKVSKRVNRHHPLFSCFFIFSALILLVFVILLWLVASTGLVRVPVITSLAYNQPEPIRIVESGQFLDKKIQQELGDVLTQRLQAGGGQINDKNISVALSEESYTASLQAAIASEAADFFDAGNAQVVIDPEVGIEIYIPVSESSLETALLVNLAASVEDDGLEAQVQSIKIGSLGVPVSLVDRQLQSAVLTPLLEQLSNEIDRFGEITGVSLSDGFLTLDGQLLVEVERLQ